MANLLKLFQRYDEIRAIEQVLRVSEEKSTAATDAEKVGLLPRVTSRARERNVDEIRKAEAELESIRSDLALYAANISQVLNREVLELKEKKDSLLRQQLQMQSRLRRIEQNLSGVRAARQRDFLALRDFFPSIDADRLSTVEAFHSGISGVLRAELRSARTHLEASLKAIDLELAEIDSALRSFLRNVAQPTRVVDRVVAVATQLREREEENAVYDEHERLTSELTTQRASLRKAREKQTGDVAARINEELVSLTTQIFAEGRRAPELLLRPTKYSYEVERDTGTGTAFASVVLLDMAVLELSQLPYLIHDSVVFKNIEAEVVSRMIQRYVRFQKQVFIAIDEAPKYGALTVKRLEKHAVCRLTNKNLLFKVDWRL
ncbi:MAG: DUF2326 domain-containing protein [Deltaproteobacteria bacterium]|nr:DUF2326 domain-containing protein [Deltaproteobacteria bacterium]